MKPQQCCLKLCFTLALPKFIFQYYYTPFPYDNFVWCIPIHLPRFWSNHHIQSRKIVNLVTWDTELKTDAPSFSSKHSEYACDSTIIRNINRLTLYLELMINEQQLVIIRFEMIIVIRSVKRESCTIRNSSNKSNNNKSKNSNSNTVILLQKNGVFV